MDSIWRTDTPPQETILVMYIPYEDDDAYVIGYIDHDGMVCVDNYNNLSITDIKAWFEMPDVS